MQSASDKEVFKLALRENRTIISADTDFGFILSQWNSTQPSIILFRRLPFSFEGHLKAIQLVGVRFGKEISEGSIVIVEPGRIRIRKLPLFSE